MNLRSGLDRRRFMALAGGGALAAAVASVAARRSPAWASPRFGSNPFSLGVASGDPTPDGVVLWTKLAPDPVAPDGSGGMPPLSVPVSWQIAEDPDFRHVVRAGAQPTGPELAHSVHVEVTGLRPGREYWYRFRVGEEVSAVGRTKTAPADGAALSSMSFAFASCQHYPGGYYTAHRHMAEEDLDLVVFLGDYIYETPGKGRLGRAHLPETECFSLTDYRIRYGQYKSDPDLQAAHAAHPWAVTMDDHEVENAWAGSISQPDDEPDQDPTVFLQRRAAAFQAYYENLPLRLAQRPVGPDMHLYRRLSYGNLAQINVVDTRQYRTDQPCGGHRAIGCEDRFDPNATMLGAEQEQWLLDGLGSSPATWNVMANQVFIMQADAVAGPEQGFSMESWNGYVAARQRLFDGIQQRGVQNFVVLTGDAHFSVAADLKANFDDPGSATVGTELLGTSMSSGGDGHDMDARGEVWLAENPHMKFYNIQRGYVRCDLTPTHWQSDFKVVPYVSSPGAPISTRYRVHLQAGVPGIQQVE